MFLQELFILLGFIWLMAKIFRQFGWPLIFGDILAGIIAGPLLLGWVHETESIKVLAELGIFFLMFHAGLEIRPREMFKAGKAALIVAFAGALLPFCLGYLVSVMFGFSVVESLFVAVSLSVTAVSVCARLFKDEKLSESRLAYVVMGAAILEEAAALILLSLVLDVSGGGGVDWIHLLLLVAKVLLFFVAVLFSGNWISQYTNRVLYKGNKGFTLVLVVALGFSVFAEMIGLHFIIGAFLAGLFIREEILDQKVFAKIEDRAFGLSYSFLGPIFFATLAFHLDSSALQEIPMYLSVLIVAAIVGKVFGAGVAALLTGMKKVSSVAVGVAMNNRGAVELIIAAIGLEKGIIGSTVFSALVVVAFITTLLSIVSFRPLAKLLRQPKPVQVQLPGIESYENE